MSAKLTYSGLDVVEHKGCFNKKLVMSSQQEAKPSQASLSEVSEVGLNIRAMGRIERVKQMPNDQRLFH